MPARHVLSLAVLCLAVSACATPGPYLRLSTATTSDLEKAEKQEMVWYEFQPGDVVPFHFLFFGALEGGADAAPMKAKQKFYLVARKNLPMEISFDGTSFAGAHASQSIVAVLPRGDGNGAKVGWIHYLGQSLHPEAELEALAKEGKEGAK